MFSRNQRVDKKTFLKTLKTGKRFSTGLFNLVFLRNSAKTEVLKFSTVVSKKILKSAVQRNYCRRVVYHAIKDIILSDAPELAPGVYILFLKSPIKSVSFQKIKTEIGKVLRLNFSR